MGDSSTWYECLLAAVDSQLRWLLHRTAAASRVRRLLRGGGAAAAAVHRATLGGGGSGGGRRGEGGDRSCRVVPVIGPGWQPRSGSAWAPPGGAAVLCAGLFNSEVTTWLVLLMYEVMTTWRCVNCGVIELAETRSLCCIPATANQPT